MGYEPDGPREEMVYPGQEATISIKIVIPRRRTKAALDAFDDGMDEYNKGSAEHYKKAVVHFQQALADDPKYSQAALYLARTYNLLFDMETGEEVLSKGHRDRPGLSRGAVDLWRHAARSGRSRRSDSPIECGGAARHEKFTGLGAAGAGLVPEGFVFRIDRLCAESDRAESEQCGGSPLARREFASQQSV